MADLRQSPQFARFLELEGWRVKKLGQDFVYFRKIPLTPFTIAKCQRPEKPDLKKLLKIAKENRALKVYFEPQLTPGEPFRSPRGWKLSRSPFLPTKTIRIDLARPLEKIKAQMKKDARYGIRKAVNTSEVTELAPREWRRPGVGLFRKAWQVACLEKTPLWSLNGVRFFNFLSFLTPNPPPTTKTLAHLSQAFGEKAIVLVATNTPGEYFLLRSPTGELRKDTVAHPRGENTFLAGAIILITGKIAYYYRAFTSKEGRKNSAQYLVVWRAIKLAKKAGCRFFDFEGINDPRFPKKAWKGFTHFKKNFGGREIEYPGCWQSVIRPTLRKAF